MEPVNHWRPVTTEYEQEPAPFFESQPQPTSPLRASTAELEKNLAGGDMPTGIAFITWFYFLRGCACFVLASLLFSHSAPDLTSWLIGHSRSMIPFQVNDTDSGTMTNLLAEGLVLTAVLSILVGGMWLMRYWRIRWITMLYAGASLARTVFFFITQQTAGLTAQLPADQELVLLIGSAANLLVLCYLAFYPGIQQTFEKSH